ncbi:MAG: penicillin-binding protein 2, partial [Burkholderiales bacterium]
MVEVRDTERDLYQLRLRLAIAMGLVLVCFGLLVARFVYLQVHRFADFHALAEDNRIALVPAPPSRGLIFDRNGVLLAENVSAYTLEIAPQGAARLDETIAALSGIIEITPRDRQRFRRFLEDSRSSDSVPLKVRLTDDEVARLAVHRFRFPDVEIRARLFRNYPLGETTAHVLGYIGRISPDDKRRLEEQERLSNYAGSTHIGKIGIEQSYESELHGQVGSEEVEVSAGGRIVRTLSRTPPVPGSNLMLSIDIRLQKLAE